MATNLHTNSIQTESDVDIVKQFVLANSSNTSLKLTLDTTGLTINRTQTFQDKSGTIALLSDISDNDSLDEILANGNNTGANNIVIDNGSEITAASGGGFLNLRDESTDGTWGLGSIDTYGDSWVKGTSSLTEIGFGDLDYYGFDASSTGTTLHGSNLSNNDYTYISKSTVGIQQASLLSADTVTLRLFPNNIARTITASTNDTGIVINNSVSLTWNANVRGSSAISLSGGTVKTNNTLYTNQIGFTQSEGNAFEGILTSIGVTADRLWELPNNSGTIALEEDLPIVSVDNGLSLVSTTVELGGTLNKSTTIERNGFDFDLTSGSNTAMLLFDSPINSGLGINIGTSNQAPNTTWTGFSDQSEFVQLSAFDTIYVRAGGILDSQTFELKIEEDGAQLQFYDPSSLTVDGSKFYKFTAAGSEIFTDGYDITYNADNPNKTLGEISQGNWVLANETTYGDNYGPNRALSRKVQLYTQTTSVMASTFIASGNAGTETEILCRVGSSGIDGGIDAGVFSFTASVIASSETGDVKVIKVYGAVKAGNGTSSLVGSPTYETIAEDPSMTGTSTTVSISSPDTLRFEATGLAGTNITWSCDVEIHSIVWDKDVNF